MVKEDHTSKLMICQEVSVFSILGFLFIHACAVIETQSKLLLSFKSFWQDQ